MGCKVTNGEICIQVKVINYSGVCCAYSIAVWLKYWHGIGRFWTHRQCWLGCLAKIHLLCADVYCLG